MQPDDENVIELLGPRRVIGQAVDLLMTSRQVTRDAAFEILVQRSSGSHQKVRDVAAAVVRHEDD